MLLIASAAHYSTEWFIDIITVMCGSTSFKSIKYYLVLYSNHIFSFPSI